MKLNIFLLSTLSVAVIAAPLRIKLSRDAAEVLHNKRDNEDLSTVDAVNYILVLHKTTDGVSAYDDEINAVANPADVLGKRDTEDLSTVDAVNYILVLHKTTDGVSAYDDEINAVANPADVLG